MDDDFGGGDLDIRQGVPMSMAGPGYAGTDNAGYRYPGEMDSGLRALVLLCIRVHGTRRSMAGLSGYPVPRSMVGYAYGYQWRVSAMRGTRYPCQWQTMIVAGWHVPPLGVFSSSPAANEKMLR